MSGGCVRAISRWAGYAAAGTCLLFVAVCGVVSVAAFAISAASRTYSFVRSGAYRSRSGWARYGIGLAGDSYFWRYGKAARGLRVLRRSSHGSWKRTVSSRIRYRWSGRSRRAAIHYTAHNIVAAGWSRWS